MASYIIHDGEICKDAEMFSASHPVVREGAIIHRRYSAYSSRLLFAESHFAFLREDCQRLGIALPTSFTPDSFSQYVYHILQQSRMYQYAVIHLLFYASSGHDTLHFLITCEEVKTKHFDTLPQDDIFMDVFRRRHILARGFEAISQGDSPVELFAKRYARKKGKDIVLLLNEVHHIARFAGKNFLLLRKKEAYLPGIDEGAFPDTMREKTIMACQKLGFSVFEECILNEKDLATADEILAIDPVFGLQWILGYKENRYYKKQAVQLKALLSEMYYG